jgi:hypothetical protein
MLLKWLSRNPLILLAGITCLAIGQCKDFEDCRSLYTSEVSIEFIPQDKDKQTPIAFKYMEVDNMRYTMGSSNRISVMLNPASNSTTIYLTRSGFYMGEVDRVTVFYQRHPSLISPLCGTQQQYVLDSLETTFKEAKVICKVLKIGKNKGEADVQVFY